MRKDDGPGDLRYRPLMSDPGDFCYRTCNVCEAMCGMVIRLENGGSRIAEIRPDKEDVFSRGHICPKGPAMREVLEDPDRLRFPMRRTASGWERVEWKAALDETAARLLDVRRRHGKNAIGLYVGNPTVHNHGAVIALQGFARALGTKNRFDANSQDANPKLFSSMLMFGDQLSVPIPDVDRTDYLLMLGANPAASNGSLMTLGDVRGRLRGIRDRGGKIVLIDPRRTETAAWCDEYHAIHPGGDAPLLLALLQVIFSEGRMRDEPAVRASTRGLDEIMALAARFPPERVAPAVGMTPEAIRGLARAFASARTAAAYGRVGTCQNEFGPQASWLLDVLNVVTGNFDRPGGVMFPTPAVDVGLLGRKLVGNHYARWKSRVRGLPEFGGQLPAAVMAEEMETPGDGQIRAFVTLAGNPVLSTPNGDRLSRALAGLDFMVAIDFYLNETTQNAHLVLPPVHALERGHYDVIFHTLAVRNTVKYSEPVVPRAPGSMDDWEILYELGMRLGGLRFGIPLLDKVAHQAWRLGLRPSPDHVIDLLLRLGTYGDRFVPMNLFHRPWGLNLAKVRAAPHGIDLGPMVPSRKTRVRTPDGRIDLAPRLLMDDCPRIDRWIEQRQTAGSLVLIGRRHLRTNNSWMHNVKSLTKGKDRATLWIHREDARRLGISPGQAVRVRSRVGSVTAPAEPTDNILQGVVSLPHGYGHERAAATLRVAGALPGPNVNALTDEERVEPLLGTAVLNGVPVTVESIPDGTDQKSSQGVPRRSPV